MMVELSSKEITIDIVSDLSEIRDSLCLWVIHADKIPPHIGVSSKGSYYSLKANGLDLALDVSHLLKVINKKEIKTLVYVVRPDYTKDLASIFSGYKSTIPFSITCLAPIRTFFNVPEAEKVHDLIENLNFNGKVEKCIGINVDSSFEGIVDYELSDINDRLNKLDSK